MCSIGGGPGPLALLDGVEKALAEYGGAPMYVLSDGELDDALGRFQEIRARLSAVELAVVREADGRGLASRVGARSVADLLRGQHRLMSGRAREVARVAAAVDGELERAGEALAAGTISYEHVATIERIMRGLHADVPADLREAAQAYLVDWSTRMDPGQIAKLGKHLHAVVNPDPDEDDVQRRVKRTLTMHDREDGMVELRGRLDPEAAAIVSAAIDPLAKPEPAVDGRPDPRSAGQRRADALVQVCQRVLGSATLPAAHGARPQIAVHVPYNTLVGLGHQPGATEHGHLPLPKTVVDRLCCDASIRRIVFGPSGEPLDVGRATRTVTPAIRAAVVARDRLCTFPGCDKPAAWSEVHHIDYWNDGGPTSLANSALICGRHHDFPHYDNWKIRIGPSGKVEWQAPFWIDDEQEWRTNPIRQAREPFLLAEEAEPP